jgi:hypothetical protein
MLSIQPPYHLFASSSGRLPLFRHLLRSVGRVALWRIAGFSYFCSACVTYYSLFPNNLSLTSVISGNIRFKKNVINIIRSAFPLYSTSNLSLKSSCGGFIVHVFSSPKSFPLFYGCQCVFQSLRTVDYELYLTFCFTFGLISSYTDKRIADSVICTVFVFCIAEAR